MTFEEQEFELEAYFLSLYGTEKSNDFNLIAGVLNEYLIYNIKDYEFNKIITICANRLSYSKTIGNNNGINFHGKWSSDTLKYDKWLLEKITPKLKELNINRICISWNKTCTYFTKRDSSSPRIYKLINNQWTKEL